MYDVSAANVLVIVVLHKDGHKVLGLPGHFPSLRGQHTDEVDVRLEAGLLVLRKRGRDLIIAPRLGSDEAVDLHSLFRDEHPDVPVAVVAHLACRVDISHFD